MSLTDSSKTLLARAYDLAQSAHRGQVDKAGKPYIEHLRAVTHAVLPFDDEVAAAAMLHDIVEDTDVTLDELRMLGFPDRVVGVVRALTRPPGHDYNAFIEYICHNPWHTSMTTMQRLGFKDYSPVPAAALVKLADNAHNSRTDRAKISATLRERYARARRFLIIAVGDEAAALVLRRINPALLSEIKGLTTVKKAS